MDNSHKKTLTVHSDQRRKAKARLGAAGKEVVREISRDELVLAALDDSSPESMLVGAEACWILNTYIPTGWDNDDTEFVNAADMAKVGRDGRIKVGKSGNISRAACKSGKSVELYFAKSSDTFESLARRWDMEAVSLLEINRVDAVINFRSLDLDDENTNKFPAIPPKHPVIRKLCDPIPTEVKEKIERNDASMDIDVFVTPADRKTASC